MIYILFCRDYRYIYVYDVVFVGARALSAGVSVQLVAHASRATNYGAIQTTGLGKPARAGPGV